MGRSLGLSQQPYVDLTSLEWLTLTSVDMNVSRAPSETSSSEGLWIGSCLPPSLCLFANLRRPDYWHLRHALLPSPQSLKCHFLVPCVFTQAHHFSCLESAVTEAVHRGTASSYHLCIAHEEWRYLTPHLHYTFTQLMMMMINVGVSFSTFALLMSFHAVSKHNFLAN